jgi:peptide/nickel transport system ATP-binding protein
MNKGLIVEQGITSEVFKNPKNNYTQNLINKNKRLKKSLTIKPNKSKVILSVKNLDLSIGNTQILNNINLKIFEGETLGLIGQSGSGKTTISKCIIGFYKNYHGEIKYDGINVEEISRYNLSRKIQLIFQDPYSALNPNIKIINQIIDPISIHFKLSKAEAKNLAIEYLEKVELKDHLFNKYPSELSGGERQRVVIARALSLKPKLIICDECVSALDKSIQNSILKLLCKLKIEFKLTFIFISHDLSLVKFMSNKIIVLKNGKIVDQNSSNLLFKKPKNYTKKLIEAII